MFVAITTIGVVVLMEWISGEGSEALDEAEKK